MELNPSDQNRHEDGAGKSLDIGELEQNIRSQLQELMEKARDTQSRANGLLKKARPLKDARKILAELTDQLDESASPISRLLIAAEESSAKQVAVIRHVKEAMIHELDVQTSLLAAQKGRAAEYEAIHVTVFERWSQWLQEGAELRRQQCHELAQWIETAERRWVDGESKSENMDN